MTEREARIYVLRVRNELDDLHAVAADAIAERESLKRQVKLLERRLARRKTEH